MQIQKILVPVDFSETSEVALSYALNVAHQINADVEVIHVVAAPPYVPLDLMLWAGPDELAIAELVAKLDQLVLDVKGDRPLSVTTRIETGVPHDIIVTAAENADLVVMGTHGRTGLPHLVLGSVAERTLRFAQSPVLVVPLARRK